MEWFLALIHIASYNRFITRAFSSFSHNCRMSLGISQANTKLCSAAHFFKNEESPNAEANNSGSQSPDPQNKVSVWRQNVARRRHSLRVSTVWLRILREFLVGFCIITFAGYYLPISFLHVISILYSVTFFRTSNFRSNLFVWEVYFF